MYTIYNYTVINFTNSINCKEFKYTKLYKSKLSFNNVINPFIHSIIETR